jgi:hypothetical protein
VSAQILLEYTKLNNNSTLFSIPDIVSLNGLIMRIWRGDISYIFIINIFNLKDSLAVTLIVTIVCCRRGPF